MYTLFVDTIKVLVTDEYGCSWTRWFSYLDEFEAARNEQLHLDYDVTYVTEFTIGLMLSFDTGKTYEVKWLQNGLSQMQINAYISSNKNYLIGLIYSGKTSIELAEEEYAEQVSKQLSYQQMLMRSKD